jgi:hypothetical protein
VNWRLFLSASGDPASPEADPDKVARRSRCGIPAGVGHVEKWQLALDMIDETRSWGIDIPLVVVDAGYGDAAAFRHGLEERNLPYAVGISSRHTAHPAGARPVQPVYAGTGRPPAMQYPEAAQTMKQAGVAGSAVLVDVGAVEELARGVAVPPRQEVAGPGLTAGDHRALGVADAIHERRPRLGARAAGPDVTGHAPAVVTAGRGGPQDLAGPRGRHPGGRLGAVLVDLELLQRDGASSPTCIASPCPFRVVHWPLPLSSTAIAP